MLLRRFTLVLLSSASVALNTPSAALDTWRSNRLTTWSRRLDRRFDADFRYKGKVRNDLRYRTQILVCGDGVRSRICEAMLDRLCEGVDADVDAMAATLGSDRRPAPELIDAGESLGLSRLPLEARARDLQPTDLLTSARWDVIVCTDLETLESVRSLARSANALDRAGSLPRASPTTWHTEQSWLQWSSHPSGEGTDASILSLTDFLSQVVPAVDCERLPIELRTLVNPLHELSTSKLIIPMEEQNTVAEQIDRSLTDLPSVGDGMEVEEIYGCAAVCCMCCLSYLEAAMKEHATRAFHKDLRESFASGKGDDGEAEAKPCWELSWEDAQEAMRMEHSVAGGLSEEERKGLFEEHASLARRLHDVGAGAAGSVRVDVSDLGLSMDDLQGPLGGLG